MVQKAGSWVESTRQPELTKWQWSSEYSTSEHQRKGEKKEPIKKQPQTNWPQQKPRLCSKANNSSSITRGLFIATLFPLLYLNSVTGA